MSPKKLYSFKLDPELKAALARVKTRDGIGESEQIRRGIVLWLEAKGERVKAPKAGRKRAATRRRP